MEEVVMAQAYVRFVSHREIVQPLHARGHILEAGDVDDAAALTQQRLVALGFGVEVEAALERRIRLVQGPRHFHGASGLLALVRVELRAIGHEM